MELKLQERFEPVFKKEWLLEKTRLNEFRDRLSNDGRELKDRATTWFEENYTNILDRIGIATKEKVEILQKKMTSLQRKVNEIAKNS